MLGCDSLKEWATLVGNVGFPMLVTAYVLVRLEKAFHGLTLLVQRLNERLDRSES